VVADFEAALALAHRCAEARGSGADEIMVIGGTLRRCFFSRTGAWRLARRSANTLAEGPARRFFGNLCGARARASRPRSTHPGGLKPEPCKPILTACLR
jgi:hypothetical protein